METLPTPLGYGMIVCPLPTNDGKQIVFAEVVPATPLRLNRKHSRSWKEPHIRWWFEIHSTGDKSLEFPDNIGAHWHEHDGGATTLMGAVHKAMDAVERVIDIIGDEAERHSRTDELRSSEGSDVQ